VTGVKQMDTNGWWLYFWMSLWKSTKNRKMLQYQAQVA